MFLSSFSSQLKDCLQNGLNIKYKIVKIFEKEKNVMVKCEFIPTGKDIEFKLIDIFNKNKLQFFSSKDILLLSERYKKQNVPNIDKKNKYYYPITILFTLCLITSNLAATKLCNFWGVTLPAGILLFPFLYILNDILTEVYGFSASRKTIWMALAFNCILSLFMYSIIFLPYPEYWSEQESFEKIFSLSPKIFLASVSSYLIGETANATILSLLKLKYSGRFFAIRAVLSTIVGASIESIIFCYIAFIGNMDKYQIINMIIPLTMIKVAYEIFIMPLTIKIVSFLKYKEITDVFEKPTLKKLVPFFSL